MKAAPPSDGPDDFSRNGERTADKAHRCADGGHRRTFQQRARGRHISNFHWCRKFDALQDRGKIQICSGIIAPLGSAKFMRLRVHCLDSCPGRSFDVSQPMSAVNAIFHAGGPPDTVRNRTSHGLPPRLAVFSSAERPSRQPIFAWSY